MELYTLKCTKLIVKVSSLSLREPQGKSESILSFAMLEPSPLLA